MYAIIRSGGKQAKVEEGDVIDVERIKSADEEITFTPLLVVTDDGTVISEPEKLAKASVHAKILREHRGNKVDVFKYKPKSGYRRSQGHRQTYTTIQVDKIKAPPKRKPPAKKPAAESAAKADTAPAKKTAKKSEEEA